MSATNQTPLRLLTWLDVERHLKQRTALWSKLPNYVQGVDCFASGMELRHRPGTEADVHAWLGSLFGHAYTHSPDDGAAIQLRIARALYPVELISEDASIEDAAPKGRTYPLWRDVTYLPTTPGLDTGSTEDSTGTSAVHERSPQPYGLSLLPTRFEHGPALVSFHSFKGGVGRTTALMTYVAACFRDAEAATRKILVIDADLEAPGISFWLDDSNRPTVSFVQLLEALHYPPTTADDSLDFFADELRKTSISISGMQRELFVLPAALDLSEIQDMPISPEHLARNPRNPWQLSDHLHALGYRLGVDAVFIDLRAGLSELASPILFDPRVDHFFVSTVAPQSVLGMAEVLKRLYASNLRLPEDWQASARPSVILSLLTRELRDSDHYQHALNALGEAYPGNDPLTPSLQWLEAEFLSTLMSIGSVREALEILPKSQTLFASAQEWTATLLADAQVSSPSSLGDAPTSPSERQQQAKKLRAICQAAEFAEGDEAAAILATEPLLNLGKHFSDAIPNALVIGAKGSGKTFTFRQVVSAGSWQAFLQKLGFDPAHTRDAAIYPVLWSENIKDKPDGEIKQAQRKALALISRSDIEPLTATQISKRIKAATKSPPDSWEDFWDELAAEQFGVSKGNLHSINEMLIEQRVRTVLVIDGIEDAFKDAEESPAPEAIQALLRMSNRLDELPNPHLGVLIFVRLDYVQAAIRQNLGQWLQRFNPFRLHWNVESFLRLAYMLSAQGNLFEKPQEAETLGAEELKTKLEALWGKKLGSEKSKEAHSARWVYAALCDLRGHIQARDLVRFLRIAADEESSRTAATWPDRLLAPESMRKAIPRCSMEKVEEAKTEIAPLRKWTQLIKDKGAPPLKIPFGAREACLDNSLLKALQDIGVIYEDKDGNSGEERLFLPEIYRHGLGFETSTGGRPRMQALLKKNIGIIPL